MMCAENIKRLSDMMTMLLTAQRFIACNQIDVYLDMCREQGVSDETLKLCSCDYVKMNGGLCDECGD